MDTQAQQHSHALIAVVDDDPSVLKSLTRLLSRSGYLVKGYGSSESLLAEIGTAPPDCVIADLAMPGLNGLDLQQSLAKLELEFPIVFVTGFGDVRSSVTAMRAGAVDFLSKPVSKDELLSAVDRALTSGRAARELASELAALHGRLGSLTRRERSIFERVAAGHLNKQIAAELGIAEKTVKVHRARVMRKMSVKSVAGLARLAEKIGITISPR